MVKEEKRQEYMMSSIVVYFMTLFRIYDFLSESTSECLLFYILKEGGEGHGKK